MVFHIKTQRTRAYERILFTQHLSHRLQKSGVPEEQHNNQHSYVMNIGINVTKVVRPVLATF